MKPPKRFSLVRRMTLFVLAVSLGSLLLHGGLLILIIKPLSDGMMRHLTDQASMARQMLAAAAPEKRGDVVTALKKVGISASRTRPPELVLDGTPYRQIAPLLAPLPLNLAPELTLAYVGSPGSPSKQLYVSFEARIDNETWWLTSNNTPMSAVAPLVPGAILVLLVGLTTALALMAGERLITRPMSELSLQLLSRREQLTPIESPPNASIELDRVIASFNQLVAAVVLANNVRRDMLAGLSHDLRTPLARLQLRIDCECQEDVANRLAPDFQALSHILSQFLAYAQGGNVSPGAPVAAGPVAQLIVDQFSATGHDVTLACDDESQLALPELALHRILSNLIDNALEHGRPPVRVTLERSLSTVRIMVSDDGEGIPEHQFEQAQQPFSKLNGDQTHVGHCGLGLAIVAQIAAQLDGRLLQVRTDTMVGIGVELPHQPG